MDRAELLEHLRQTREETEALLAGRDEASLTAPGAMGDWSVKDILAHLTAWEAEAVRVVTRLRLGQKANLPAASEVDALNAKWQKESRSRPLDSVLDDFRGVRRQMLRQVESLTEADLAKKIPGAETSLGQMIAEETYEHEAEHRGQMG